MTVPAIRYYESAGLTLSYRAFGNPSNPLLLAHHGFLDCAAAWDEVLGPLASQYHVIAVDARGHGDSAWVGAGGAYWFPDYVLDLTTLMQILNVSKDRPCAMVGHSMGGVVCAYTAGTYPDHVNAIVLIEGLGPPKYPWSYAPTHMRQFIESTRKRHANREPEVMESVAAAASRLQHYDALLGSTQALRHAQLATRAVPGGCIWKWDPLHRARMGAMYVEEIAAALMGQINAPTLLVTGEKSPFRQIDVTDRRSALTLASDVMINDAGHNIHRHQPDALRTAVQQFLHENI